MIIPKKWFVYVVDLEPRVGTKPGKQRPCLCIQPSEFCEMGLKSAVVLPITTNVKKKAKPLRVNVAKGICQLSKESDVMVDQMLAWDVSLFREELGELPLHLQEEVRVALLDFLDL
ncbi:MAG: taxon MazF [Bdellovibrio sp. CG12_big_fil_rev_8_21_14_0_65_39_13]|nr:MAG: taxon MazF [Bdellovibrio sp. CG22_combo_CG10-13_8_21_14_all_39_27]PIQ59442.1 MAG: taxon MazF [Bdellovibrio sp. CG12_big_fil_rev_8_21_14_0_65_39_13]PIR33907.1 MAG: taxon MazF [Bdellovibrio sp. CG11_big_fil_rev_8_21_14_0_20_39_38]